MRTEVVIRSEGAEYEAVIQVTDSDVRIAGLAEHLGHQGGVSIDGRAVADETPVLESGIHRGAILDLGGDPDGAPVCRLVALGGPLLGEVVVLRAGSHDLASFTGRGEPGAARLIVDPSGSLTVFGDAVSVVQADDDRPGGPVTPGSVIRAGEDVFLVDSIPGPAPVDTRGRRVFNRPPRAEFPVTPPPLLAPAKPPAIGASSRFGWAALVVPMLLGGVLAYFFGPMMAMIAILSPAMMIANWMEDRRRVRRERRTQATGLAGDLAEFRRRLTATVGLATSLRNRATPAPETVIRRALTTDARLWERRPAHADFLRVGIGVGCMPWEPQLLPGEIAPEAEAELRRYEKLHDVPVLVDLREDRVLGVAGARRVSLEAARSLVCQAAVLHGPADLAMVVVTDQPTDWDWVKWLPHVVADEASNLRAIVTDLDDVDTVVGPLLERDEATSAVGASPVAGPATLVILDVVDLAAGRHAAVRDLVAGHANRPIAAIALAADVTRLPSVCNSILELSPTGDGRLRVPARNQLLDGISVWRLAAGAARRCSRALGSLSDPDARSAASNVPDRVDLLDLLGFDEMTADTVIHRWTAGGRIPAIAGPIGSGPDGPLVLDVVDDGPHALLAGTTGAGKSELLRSIVASLAASVDPEHLNFVLVDYKGGSAFDACEALPHTVGLVTDLDGHLAQRALTCLEAELRYREHRLRDHGAGDLAEYLELDAAGPLPRLLVVIDEFAALAKELPDFVASLVDIAQRGRSLGVHLMLATQRPSGVINDNIRANTNLRISLRVQDKADSADIIGTAEAAAIARTQPGRGYIRRGPGDIVPFQSALVTGRTAGGARRQLAVAPFMVAARQPAGVRDGDEGDDQSDLVLLVEAIRMAAAKLELAEPRLPWPDALPAAVSAGELDAGTAPAQPVAAPIALVDEPHLQRRSVRWWTPADGNVLVYGVAGSGTSTYLASIVCGLAERCAGDDVHMYVLDFDDQLLAPLAALPHVGAVVGAAERDRQTRLLRYLQREVEQRRVQAADDPVVISSLPTILLLVDNYAGFSAAFEDPSDMAIKASLSRLIADGAGVGIYVIATAKQPTDIPSQVASLVPNKLALKLSDRYEYSALGLTAMDPPDTAGRGFESATGREVQIALPGPGTLAAAVAAIDHTPGGRRPWVIDVLPAEVKLPDIVESARIFDLEWTIPLGLGDADLAPLGFVLREGDHALVAGPPRSGRSTTLATAAAAVKHARPDVRVTAIAYRRSPLRDSPDVDLAVSSADQLAEVATVPGPHLLLVDDADILDDPQGVIAGLVAERHPDVHVIAAGAADLLRSAYGHWTQDVRRSRIGIALKPNLSADGDLWQTPLPRKGPLRYPPGRGYLVADGRCELIQVAWQ